jgi:hypothetical protein
MKSRLDWTIATCLAFALAAGCGGGSNGDADSRPDGSSDADSDSDSDGDADGDSDSETGTGAGQWPGPPWCGCTDDDVPGDATLVTAFDQADQYFGDDDLRTIESELSFPEGEWERIEMRIDLDCPTDGDCDNWDRFANVMLVLDSGGPEERSLELARYITAYDVGMCILADVTGFGPLMSGDAAVRSFIDTWVGPDEPVHGHGWRTSIDFIFHPGSPPDDRPSSVAPLWSYRSVVVGDPQQPLADQAPPAAVEIPADATRVELRVVSTGHGQGNADNCAEFCHLQPVVSWGDQLVSYDPWRYDCGDNPIGPLQSGTWAYGRSGWCPGAYVLPEVFDITEQTTPGQQVTFELDYLDASMSSWENTCRPGAGDENDICEGCVFHPDEPGNCEYNGGDHTEPAERISVQLVTYS